MILFMSVANRFEFTPVVLPKNPEVRRAAGACANSKFLLKINTLILILLITVAILAREVYVVCISVVES